MKKGKIDVYEGTEDLLKADAVSVKLNDGEEDII